jgi:ectoine hydroxylase-related dioxygenase (phytanoyl-CoA dioxygenase family)
MQPFLDSTDIQHDGVALRERMHRDGYLLVRGLLPAAVLESLRLRCLEVAREAGWVAADTPLADAIANMDGFCVEPQPAYMEPYYNMYKLPEFHAIQHHKNLLQLLEGMLGETALPHPRLIGRTIFPKREAFTTPAHQDFIPIQGTAETYTAWFPLADLPPQMGGLQVAAGSHRHGVYDFVPCNGAGGLEITDPLDGMWHGGPFEQGDVLFFHSMAVHKGLPNVSESLRLSMDARYQRVSEKVAAGSLEPHVLSHSWEEIYAAWPSDEHQYYWRQWNMEIKEYDHSYHDRRDEQAFAMAAQGDGRSRSTLQRIIARDNNASKRQQASQLLDGLDANQEKT